MAEENKTEEIVKSGFDLVKFLTSAKFVIPIIITLISGAFGAGYKIQNEMNKVVIARMEIKHEKEISALQKSILDLSSGAKNINTNIDKKKFIFLYLYLDYVLSKNVYVQKGGETNLLKLQITQRTFAKFIKTHKQHLISGIGEEGLDEYLQMSTTSIRVGNKDWPIPQDILLIVEEMK